ncbi:MAG: hypothetical protein NC099_00745 [Corallococcus sp.]|nr:hypothetical protein [Corallococcus sp.]
MKRLICKNTQTTLLEKRIIDEERARAELNKQIAMANMREYRILSHINKNGGLL